MNTSAAIIIFPHSLDFSRDNRYICICQYITMMKKIHFLLLISLLLAACSDDDKEKQPAFVTNITISDAGKTFNPGDAVTVKADGLQSGDQIILDIYWPIADNPLFPEGYSRYTRAVTTEQTTNSITFLAPDTDPPHG